ncbi:hypothetical protein Bca52824_029297 [Brassica carinata]|uniref:Uncharacterized protein n=1 Tax=Brassica carinata TaxID=52824 RepID=A0A8X8APB8_BRACI|nr:hypothetical protein Bca52824_029297 [Brassica carinata]
MSCRRSERDGRILARRFGCKKEGHRVSVRGKPASVRKPRPSTREGCNAGQKGKRIQELTIELRNEKRLCAAYKEQLDAFAKIVEEHSDRMSKKVESVVENLEEFEHIELEMLHSKQDDILSQL